MTFYGLSNIIVSMSGYRVKNFRFGDKGLGKVLGHLEKDIMDVLWGRGEATAKEVLEELRGAREIATTTVFTVLDRLAKKGLVQKVKGGSFYNFRPVYTRDELSKEVSEEVIKGVLDLFSSSAVASFVDMLSEKDPKELDRLARLIEEKKREIEEGDS